MKRVIVIISMSLDYKWQPELKVDPIYLIVTKQHLQKLLVIHQTFGPMSFKFTILTEFLLDIVH